ASPVIVNSACSRLTCSLLGRRWQVSPRPILNFGPTRGITFPSGLPRTTTSCTFMKTVPTPGVYNDSDPCDHEPGFEHPVQPSGLIEPAPVPCPSHPTRFSFPRGLSQPALNGLRTDLRACTARRGTSSPTRSNPDHHDGQSEPSGRAMIDAERCAAGSLS